MADGDPDSMDTGSDHATDSNLREVLKKCLYNLTFGHKAKREEIIDEVFEIIKATWDIKTLLKEMEEENTNTRDAIMAVARKIFSNKVTEPPSEESQSQIEATKEAWGVPYVGQSANLFISALELITRSTNPVLYGNIMPMIQSSGTGKSRTVHQAAARLFTIPINLREDTNSTTFPEPDKKVRNYMIQGPALYDEARISVLCLLSQIFVLVTNEVTLINLSESGSNLAMTWREALGDAGNVDSKRCMLYQEAVDLASNYMKAPAYSDSPHSEKSLKGEVKELQNAVRKTRDAADGLQTAIKLKIGKNASCLPGYILISFDESHTLCDVSTSLTVNNRKTPFDALAWCLDRLKTNGILAVFPSTQSHLASFASPVALHPSERVSREHASLVLPIPFTELPFDLPWPNNPIVRDGGIALGKIQQVEFLSRFGRPLWYTRFMKGTEPMQHNLVQFAREKLIGVANPAMLGESQVLAVLSTRLLLEFEPTRTLITKVKEATQVERHMRIAYCVPSHREYMRSGCPSEPILAEAAAQLSAEIPNIPAALADFVNNGLVERGHAGELAARTILTQAYDRAIEETRGIGLRDTVPYSQGCDLSQFMKHLFGEEHYRKLEMSTPDNLVDGVTFGEAFKDSLVSFTHFGRAFDSTVITPKFSWVAFLRCMAVQCCVNQTYIDIIIPILLDKNEPVAPSNMTALMVQVKNGSDAEHAGRLNWSISKVKFLPEEARPLRPYLNIIMQLGLEGHSFEVMTGPTRSNRTRKLHPRYTIDARGYDEELYPVMKGSRRETYRALLLSRSLLDEHGRQGEEFLDGLKEQKPFWTDSVCKTLVRDYDDLDDASAA